MKSVEYGATSTWVVIECLTLEAKKTLLPLTHVEFVGSKLKVERPKKFLSRVLGLVTEVPIITDSSFSKTKSK